MPNNDFKIAKIDPHSSNVYNGSLNNDIVLLRFENRGAGKILGRYNKKNVIPDEGSPINEGTYICSVELSESGKNYTATMIEEVDPSFFMRMDSIDKKKVLEALWFDHKDDMILKYNDNLQSGFEEKLDLGVAQKTAQLKSEMEQLKSEKESIEADNRNLNSVIEELNKKIQQLKNAVPETPEGDAEVPFDEAIRNQYEVTRVGPDMIKCSWFTKARYFCHMDVNRTKIVIRPHDYGSVRSFGDVLVLTGLNTIARFHGEGVMESTYDPDEDCLTIRL